jgi:hypothetical protein
MRTLLFMCATYLSALRDAARNSAVERLGAGRRASAGERSDVKSTARSARSRLSDRLICGNKHGFKGQCDYWCPPTQIIVFQRIPATMSGHSNSTKTL